MLELLEIGIAAAVLAALIGVGVWTGALEMRPFRTSAVAFGLGLLLALWMVLSIIPAEGYEGGLIDGTLIGVVFTAFATAITKLSDDGGESETVAIVRMFLEKND